MNRPTAEEIIELLGLEPHPEEGGFFRETYRAGELHAAEHLDARYGGDRHHATAIYYLLTPDTFSAMHRLRTDEIFHHYQGGAVEMLRLFPDGRAETAILGSDLAGGQRPQVVVPRGVWQGAQLLSGEFALLGCTVCPGFEFVDYEHGQRAELVARWPGQTELINRLTTG